MTLSHRTSGLVTTVLLMMPLGFNTASPAEDDEERAKPAPKPPEWPIYRGDAARSNRGSGKPPVLRALWRKSMFYDVSSEERHTEAVKERVRQFEKKLQQKQQPVIPAFSPLALTALDHKGEQKALLLCKDFHGITALDRNKGNLLWDSPSNGSLQRVFANRRAEAFAMSRWLDEYENQSPQIVFENSTISTISTDGRFVYAVTDLAVAPPVVRGRQEGRSFILLGPPLPIAPRKEKLEADVLLDQYGPDTTDAILHNRLHALSLARSGALAWALGDDEKDPLSDCYFLGPPLPLDGRLYMLTQKKQQILLLCIDPPSGDRPPFLSKIVYMTRLVEVATPLIQDPIRRTQAAHVAYGEGILVCPTNAGIVFGFDRQKQRLAWDYSYQKKIEKAKDSPAAAAPIPNRWKTTAPVIAEGKVIFTPPDDHSIHCLNLTDGSLLWSRKKSDDDVYLGGVSHGKVLIVGTKRMHSLSLANGETLWTRETGLPSGQGITADNLYYLPLERGTESKQPEICVIDLNTGQAIAHHKMPSRKSSDNDFDVPGNLLFVEGKLISQSPWEIVAYPTRGDN